MRFCRNIRAYHAARKRHHYPSLSLHGRGGARRQIGWWSSTTATIPLTGTPQEVFSHEKELTAMGLGIPKVTQVCERLRSMGLRRSRTAIYTWKQLRLSC